MESWRVTLVGSLLLMNMMVVMVMVMVMVMVVVIPFSSGGCHG